MVSQDIQGEERQRFVSLLSEFLRLFILTIHILEEWMSLNTKSS